MTRRFGDRSPVLPDMTEKRNPQGSESHSDNGSRHRGCLPSQASP